MADHSISRNLGRWFLITYYGQWLSGRLSQRAFVAALLVWMGIVVIFFLPFNISRYVYPESRDYTQGAWFLWLLAGVLLTALWCIPLSNICIKRCRDAGKVELGFFIFLGGSILAGAFGAAGLLATFVITGFVLAAIPSSAR